MVTSGLAGSPGLSAYAARLSLPLLFAAEGAFFCAHAGVAGTASNGVSAVSAWPAGGEAPSALEHFITRDGDRLLDGVEPFRFIGAANTELMFPGPLPADEYEIRDAFETMRQMGQTAVRTYCFYVENDLPEKGAMATHIIGNRLYNEEAFRSLDKTLQVANEYGIRVIIPFFDNPVHFFGANAGVFAQMHGATDFFKARAEFKQFLLDVVSRTNTFTGIRYRDDKAILAWQLGNELPVTAEWESEIAAYLKKIDPNHLVASALSHPQHPLTHEASLTNPDIDIIDRHVYPGPPGHIDAYWNPIRGKKVLIFGEFGGIGGPQAVRQFLDQFIASGVSGANWWAVISRCRSGGYSRFHPEHQGYSRLHWPYWDDEIAKLHTTPGILTALQDGAFKLQGKSVPAQRCPVPRAPELLPIDDQLRISWRGAAGARRYEVQRAADPAGPWTTVGADIKDHCAPGWFGAIFAHEGAPKGAGWYRIRALNDAGASPWSNVVEVGAPHPVLTKLYLGPSLVPNWSFEKGAEGWQGIGGPPISLTKEHRFSGASAVQFRNSDGNSISSTVTVKPQTEYLLMFWYRMAADVKLVATLFPGGAAKAEHTAPPSPKASWSVFSTHFNSGTNRFIRLDIGVRGSEAYLDDVVVVENPQTMVRQKTDDL
jgi:hypothetical protein